MNYFLRFCQIFVGSFFIVSGFIKANDLLGFSYKLEEYFSPAVLHLEFLSPYALIFSVLICIGEIFLGFAFLLDWWLKITGKILFSLTIFFGFLTFYSAYFDVVHDCGCFGDALKGSLGRSLSPWESFFKDLMLFLLILPVLFFNPKVEKAKSEYFFGSIIGGSLLILFWSFIFDFYSIFLFSSLLFICFFLFRKSKNNHLFQAFFTLLLSLGFCYSTYHHLPLKDYSAYALEKNIPQQMKSCFEIGKPCPEKGVIYHLENKTTGEKIWLSDRDYQKIEADQYVFLEQTKDTLYKEGYEPAITDFYFFNAQNELLNERIFEEKQVFLLIIYQIDKIDKTPKNIDKIRNFIQKTHQKNTAFYLLTGSDPQQTTAFLSQYQIEIPVGFGDPTLLKAMVRSNPGLLYLEKGKILGKWHINDFPIFEEYARYHKIAYERKMDSR